MILFNTHTHTQYSSDGHNTVAEFLQQARQLGVSYIAFTDHFDPFEEIDYSDKINHHFGAMVKDMQEYQTIAKKDNIHIEIGIEIGWDTVGEQSAIDLLQKHDISYVINSLHYINAESCYYPSFFDDKTKQVGYELYLQNLYKTLDAHYRYDTIGHISYCARNAPFSDPIMHYNDHKTILDKIIDKIIDQQKIIELNTSVRTAQSGVLPNDEILRQYKKRGGELITFASDSHWKEHLIEGFDTAKTIAQNCGFSYYTIKKNGKFQQIKIE